MVNFIITAENPAGPWSDPFHIQGAPGIDPDLFFNDDGRVWYVGNQMPENPTSPWSPWLKSTKPLPVVHSNWSPFGRTFIAWKTR